MRPDAAGARTRLLAAIALWAVWVWLLALFGLGGRIAALPEDPSLLQPLPQGGVGGDERLGPLPQYAEIGDRPLFAADRRHRPFFLDPQGEGEEGPGEFDVVLTSVMITPDLQMAIVQPSGGGEPLRIKVGEAAPGAPAWSLTSVGPRSAVFAGPEGERALELRVFDGVGGEPPTPVTRRPDDGDGGRRRAPPPPVVLHVPAPSAGQPAAPDAETAVQAAASAADPAQAATEEITPAAQAEAIRRRIEARRARLRQEAQQQAAGQEQNP
ncbi:general secretion pathway protein GspN [Luteimonas sp. RD2P54]|uniref:General secretion pathway protein GspN n=1 Tax=Luteimonas endophytica TaxID=3042023 RepID=A0ABT6J6A2_9GAMM|nr:general secretion pathway protein GspN [Luteimonas endophytica]MDH5822357.1 general secretion pathway protein GspN [Luteimonas endophytica]